MFLVLFFFEQKKHLLEELDQDEGIGTQSFQSVEQTQRTVVEADIEGHSEMYNDEEDGESTQLEEQDLDQDEEEEDDFEVSILNRF